MAREIVTELLTYFNPELPYRGRGTKNCNSPAELKANYNKRFWAKKLGQGLLAGWKKRFFHYDTKSRFLKWVDEHGNCVGAVIMTEESTKRLVNAIKHQSSNVVLKTIEKQTIVLNFDDFKMDNMLLDLAPEQSEDTKQKPRKVA